MRILSAATREPPVSNLKRKKKHGDHSKALKTYHYSLLDSTFEHFLANSSILLMANTSHIVPVQIDFYQNLYMVSAEEHKNAKLSKTNVIY